MSRGLGQIQRKVLALVAARRVRGVECDLDTFVLTRLVYDVQPDEHDSHLLTDAQVVSVRRALRQLERAGKVVCLGRGYTDGRARWVTPERAAQHNTPKRSLLSGRGPEENT